MPVAKDVMTKKVVTVEPKEKAAAAIAKLVKNKVSGVPVVDEAGKVVGMLSEADLLTARSTQNVESLMSKPAVTVAADASLKAITDALVKKKIKRVAVVDKENHLLGVVSRIDILKTKVK